MDANLRREYSSIIHLDRLQRRTLASQPFYSRMKLKHLILTFGIFMVGLAFGYRYGFHEGSRATRMVTWQYTNVTDVTSWMTDARTLTNLRDGWKIFEVQQEPPWVGGADRPERTNFKFRSRIDDDNAVEKPRGAQLLRALHTPCAQKILREGICFGGAGFCTALHCLLFTCSHLSRVSLSTVYISSSLSWECRFFGWIRSLAAKRLPCCRVRPTPGIATGRALPFSAIAWCGALFSRQLHYFGFSNGVVHEADDLHAA